MSNVILQSVLNPCNNGLLRMEATVRLMLCAVMALVFSACDLEARSESRSRRRAIQESEQEARLARARYCTENPAECVADDRARQEEAAARRERKAAKMRAIGQAMQQYGNAMQQPTQTTQQAPTYRCRRDYTGGQTCRPQ
jgi:hypothetical protein